MLSWARSCLTPRTSVQNYRGDFLHLTKTAMSMSIISLSILVVLITLGVLILGNTRYWVWATVERRNRD